MPLKDEDFLLKQKEKYEAKLNDLGVELDLNLEDDTPFVDDLMDKYGFDPTILTSEHSESSNQHDTNN